MPNDSTVQWTPRCSVCKHPQSDVIDQHIITRDITMDKISKIFGISKSALGRHQKNCIRAKARSSREILKGAAATRQAATTLSRTDEVFETAKPLLELQVQEGNVEGASRIIASLHENIRLRGELTRELVAPGSGSMDQASPGSRVQVIMMPTVAGKSPEEISRMISAPALNLDEIRAQETELD